MKYPYAIGAASTALLFHVYRIAVLAGDKAKAIALLQHLLDDVAENVKANGGAALRFKVE